MPAPANVTSVLRHEALRYNDSRVLMLTVRAILRGHNFGLTDFVEHFPPLRSKVAESSKFSVF